MLATHTVDPEDPASSAGQDLFTINAGGFSATVDAFARDERSDGLWFVSMVGSQTALKAIWASLLKQPPDTAHLIRGADGMALSGGYQRCQIPHETLGTWTTKIVRLPATGGWHALVYSRTAEYAFENDSFLLLAQSEEEAPALHHRFLDRRSPLPLHGSWAGWLWERGIDEKEIVPLQSVGVSAYRCSPRGQEAPQGPVRRGGVGQTHAARRDVRWIGRPSERWSGSRPNAGTSQSPPEAAHERRDDMRLAAQAKGGFYPTPERVVDLIADLIHTPLSHYNAGTARRSASSTPAAGRETRCNRLAGERLDRPNAMSIETYGVELHRDRAEEAEERLDRTLASDLFATSIANGAFGLLLLNPPYDFDSEDRRTEHVVPDADDALPGRERPARVHRAQAAPRGLGALPVNPLRADAVLGVPIARARGLRPGRDDGLPEGRSRSRCCRREHGARVVPGRAGAAAPPSLYGVHARHDAERRRPVHHPHGRSHSGGR